MINLLILLLWVRWLLRIIVFNYVTRRTIDTVLLEATRVDVGVADVHFVEVYLLEDIEVSTWVKTLVGC